MNTDTSILNTAEITKIVPIYIGEASGDPVFHHAGHTPKDLKDQRDALLHFLTTAVPQGDPKNYTLLYNNQVISPKSLNGNGNDGNDDTNKTNIRSLLLFGNHAHPLYVIPNTSFAFPLPTLCTAVVTYRNKMQYLKQQHEEALQRGARPTTVTPPDPVEILRVLVNRAYNPTTVARAGRQSAASAKKDTVKRLYNGGLGADYIARTIGTSRATVYDMVKRMREAGEYGLISHSQYILARRRAGEQRDDTIASQLSVHAESGMYTDLPPEIAANYKNLNRQRTKEVVQERMNTLAAVQAMRAPLPTPENTATSTTPTTPTNPQEIDAAYNRKVEAKLEELIETARANDKEDEPTFDRGVVTKRIAEYQQMEDELMTSREKLEVTMCIVARASLLPVLEQRARQKVEEYAALHDGNVDFDDAQRIDYEPPLVYLDRLLRGAAFKPTPLPQWEDE